MVPQVSVRVGGKEIDILDSREFPLSLDFQIEDLIDFTTRKGGSSSRSFKIPATVNNDKIFNLFGTYSSASANVKIFEDIEIFFDGVPISTGSAILKGATRGSDKYYRVAKEYEAIFLLDNSDWFLKLDGKTLNELSFTSHDYTIPNISGSYWDGDLSFSDYGYTLIKWKNWINESAGYIVYEDFTPFLYIADIVEKSFNSIGYTIDSTFLASSFARRLILPIPLSKYREDYFIDTVNMRATSLAPITVTLPTNQAKIPFDDDFTSPNFDAGGNYSTGTFTYTAPQAANYRLRTSFIISNIVSTGSAPYTFRIGVFINGIVDTFNPAYNINNGDTLELDRVYTLAAGDTIEVLIGNPLLTTTSFQVDAGALLEITASSLPFVLGESSIDFSALVPKHKLSSIIAGFSELFNLYIFADPASKVVRIEPRGDFFDGRKDITQDIDLSRDGAKAFNQLALNTIYNYKSDSNDDTIKEFENNSELGIYSAKYVSANPLATGATSKNNSFFAPTINIKDDSISGLNNTDTAPQIPLIYPGDIVEDSTLTTTDYDFLPRILYHKGVTTFDGSSTAPSPEGTISLLSKSPTTRSGYPKSFMTNYDDISGLDPNISYARETLYSGVSVAGLLEDYFLNHLATLNNGVQVTDFIRYKLTDILSLNFRDKYFISGIDYILQKIVNYSPITGRSTKIIMIEDICAAEEDLQSLENNNFEAVIKL